MRKRLLVRVLSVVVALPLIATSANADSFAIDFEDPPYHIGSIDHQGADPANSWAGTLGAPINILIDQEVVTNTFGYASFGGQSWRISNAYTDGAFGDWPFSPSLTNEAGETQAQSGVPYSGGTRQRHFEAEWDFASTVPNSEQEGLQISTSPDRGDGARMSFIRMRDNPSGLSVEFVDYQDKKPYGSQSNPSAGCGAEDDFVLTTVANGLSRLRPHTVKLTIDFIDGPRNDVVRVFVDNTLRHKGTSWEDYYRWCTESGGGTGTNADQSRTVDSMIFQARTVGGEAPDTADHGLLFDNLTLVSSQCHKGRGDGHVEKDKGKAHFKFDKGCGEKDADVEEDSSGEQFQSTSITSSTFTSNGANQTLTIIGTGLDNGLPVSFTMIAVDNGDVAPSVFTLILSDGYVVDGPLLDGFVSLD